MTAKEAVRYSIFTIDEEQEGDTQGNQNDVRYPSEMSTVKVSSKPNANFKEEDQLLNNDDEQLMDDDSSQLF